MGRIEAILFWLTVLLYLVSFISYLAATVFKRERGTKYGWNFCFSAFIFHTLTIAVRWAESGHPPVMYHFENALAGAWFVMIFVFVLSRRFKKIRAFGVIITPLVLLMLGHGVMAGPELEPLSPPFKSNWLWVHVTFAWLAYGSFIISAGLGIIYLLKERALKKKKDISFYHKFPSLERVEDIILRLVIFGLISQTVMIVSGSIWAYGLWGRYWGWDPVETFSLITWLIYGIFLHFRLTLGWKGRRAAWLVIGAVVSVLVSFWGISALAGLHTPLL